MNPVISFVRTKLVESALLQETLTPLTENASPSPELSLSNGPSEEGVLVFEGTLLTAPRGPLFLSDEARKYAALFENGLWLVSKSHALSPMVTSIDSMARKLGYAVKEPVFVSPDIIQKAYRYAEGNAHNVVRLDHNAIKARIEKMIASAAKFHASDIHIQTKADVTSVEFAVEGELRIYEQWTPQEGQHALSAVYTHCDVPSGVVEDFYQPQAGMLAGGSSSKGIALPAEVSGIRCQWVPTDKGRYLVMRLHYPDVQLAPEMQTTLSSLGYEPFQMRLLQEAKNKPGGLRLMSGPTNHGKTTSLKVLLSERVEEIGGRLNLIQIEDPPEGGIQGARQIGISVNDERGAREEVFGKMMRTVLRLAPDMLMLGEIRDADSAAFAMRLSLIGSQVYTTIHVHNALSVPKRLIDLGIEPYLVYDSYLITALMSQRLVRKLCPHCKIPLNEESSLASEIEEKILMALEREGQEIVFLKEKVLSDSAEQLKNVFLANPTGCPECSQGYKGRTVAAEIILPDARLMKLLEQQDLEGATTYWLSADGLQGCSMRHHGLDKVIRGEISPLDFEKTLGPLVSVMTRKGKTFPLKTAKKIQPDISSSSLQSNENNQQGETP